MKTPRTAGKRRSVNLYCRQCRARRRATGVWTPTYPRGWLFEGKCTKGHWVTKGSTKAPK